MQVGNVTAPFGPRRMSIALVNRQVQAADIKAGKSIDKWKVFRDVSQARGLLGLQDRAITVLDALLSFYPKSELSEEHGLVVFPSNEQLSHRAHGIAGTTLRRHLAVLVEAGIIFRRDSPNGKRYAHRARGGEIEQAYGFSLAPLLARVEEFAILAQQVVEERRLLKRAKEALTICRRDVRKLITAAVEEGADGDWETIEAMFVALVGRIPRSPSQTEVDAILDEMGLLRDEVLNILNMQHKAEKMDSNAAQIGCHIQNSNPESLSELEPRSEKEQGAPLEKEPKRNAKPMGPLPLTMILRACPEITAYVPQGGTISGWRDLMSAAVVVKSMLGISPSAYQDACDTMGPENAATAVACILEREGHINSPGGYLRDLTRRAERGEFSLGPMIMALMRSGASDERRSA
ncbi:MAG: replication initiation protein RepC [Sphingomonas hengshuiensis]|nr:MAG: replication initiation protein RepC [Sphingomonas hengshuiensis]